VHILEPYTTYVLDYRAGTDAVNYYLLAALTDTGADAFSNAGPAPSGVWAATGNFQAAEIPEEFRPSLEGGDDLPPDFYLAQVLSDEVTAGYAGPRAPLCTFTTGPAGRVYLDLRMYLCDPDTGQYVCLRAGRGFLVAEEIGLRGGRRSLVGEDSASRAARGALTPEAVAACVEGGPAGLGWLARLAVLAAAVGLDPPTWPSADLDGDGDVDLADFALLASSFGATGGATYTWDAENRLLAVTPAYRVIGGDRKVEFGYDYLGRRVVKRVYAWNGSAWVPPVNECAVRKFVYDGWRVIMELDGSNGDAVLRQHTWGLDLSGSLEGAGGIGGLLGTLDTAGTVTTADDRTFIHFYDANGNVGQVLETTPGPNFGTIAASYLYTPYGSRLNTPPSGHDAYDQPFRFSTKWFDAETALGYWGRRYYHAEMGRWISEDPVGERGGWNLYRYVRSRPNQWIDAIGLQVQDPDAQPGPRPADPEPNVDAPCRPGLWKGKPDPHTNSSVQPLPNPNYKRPTNCCDRKKNGEDVVSKPDNCFLIAGSAQTAPGHCSAGLEGCIEGIAITLVGHTFGARYCYDDYLISATDKGKGAIYECCCLSDAEKTKLETQFDEIIRTGGRTGKLPGVYLPTVNDCSHAALALVGGLGCPALPTKPPEPTQEQLGEHGVAYHAMKAMMANSKYCGVKYWIDDPYYTSRPIQAHGK